jgi:23S rRNA (uracil1939-C5)-methyltransferase
MKKDKNSRAFETKIEKLVYGGMGIGRHQGKVVFVPFSIPGDHLLVQPIDEKKTFIRAEILQILKSGNGRISAVCPYFGKCGGCHWQQLDYLRQVEAKRQILEEILHHRFPETLDLPIVMRACPQPWAYRSRARVQTRGSGSASTVGFFRAASHAIEDVQHCPLFRPFLNDALSSLRQFKSKDRDPLPQEWDLACSEENVTWAATRTGSIPAEVLLPSIETRTSDEVILRRKIGEFDYSTTPSAFFQANDFMISELVRLVQESTQNAGSGTALDLFSGVGLFSLPLARFYKKIIAVETSPASCRLCSANASIAGLDGIQIVCADVLAWMHSKAASDLQFDLIVLDPPRTGAGIGVMERIKEWAPDTIVYVSCDPQTLSRDLAMLSPAKYEIRFVEGLDLFPQTYHFETVVRLAKRR